MTYSKHHFTSFTPCVRTAKTATDEAFQTVGYGTVSIELADEQNNPCGLLEIDRAWYAPALSHNLISCKQLARQGVRTHIETEETTVLIQHGKQIGFATAKDAQYFLHTTGTTSRKAVQGLYLCGALTRSPPSDLTVNTVKKTVPPPISIHLAHRRTAHASERKIRDSVKHVVGFDIKKGILPAPCEPCLRGKGQALPVSHTEPRDLGLRVGDLIHTDVCGPLPTRGQTGAYYFVTFTDHASRYCWVFLLKERSEVRDKFITLQNYLKRQLNINVKRVHGDNAPEHQPLASYCQEQGIVWDPAPRYRSNLNPIAEIKNRHLVEPCISVMADNQLPRFLWDHIILAVNYIQNRLVHSAIGKTPYEALYGVQPDISRWKALGCRCWHLTPKKTRDKLEDHMQEGRFVGYSESVYKIYDIRTRQIMYARDVIFNEEPVSQLPSATSTYDLDSARHGEANTEAPVQEDPRRWSPFDIPSQHQQPVPVPFPSYPAADEQDSSEEPDWLLEYKQTGVLPPLPAINDTVRNATPEPAVVVEDNESEDQLVAADPPAISTSRTEPAPVSEQPLRRSTRTRRPSRALLESLESHTISVNDDPDLNTDAFYKLLIDNHLTNALFLETAATQPPASPQAGGATSTKEPTSQDTGYTPTSYADAMACAEASKWREAVHREMREQIKQGTFRVVPRPRNTRLLPLKWVFKIKHDGTYKARLVVKGFRQRAGKDYQIGEIYAAVAKSVSFKTFIALAAKLHWILHHLDVVTAFLNAELRESIHIELPDGFQENGMCGELVKSLYGLKQAPREWYNMLHDFLVANGFKCLHADHSVFAGKGLFILVYVDDILLLAPDGTVVDAFKTLLAKLVKFTDNGPCTRFLGVDIIQTDEGIYLSQKSYIQDCLKRFGLSTCKTSPIPYNSKNPLSKYNGTADPDDIKAYQERNGALIWIMVNTRPDIAYATSKLSSFASNPAKPHLQAMNLVWRYLAGSLDRCPFYRRGGPGLVGFCDADWAGPHSLNATSTSGYVFQLAGGPISWSSKKQTAIALSSTESEYIAQAVATQELIWLQLLFTELDIQRSKATSVLMSRPTIIHADNQSAIALTKNPEFHARTKHVSIKWHFIRREVRAKNVEFVYISTTEQAADGLTKPLERLAYSRFIKQLGMVDRG
ncbi:hypothetical protein CBS147343_10000 [Aspergillus niger]|nr:hypothetical protein CBS12448_11016 [Aspergillus niger]KAI2969529.1 hypothetical protein CBS147482_10928 [Aspergillus niger]KAI2978678.1 hypothetical protein CBS147344_10930 [Aspergillus niger]KAI3043945.1 hypothetical protein CBS147352_8411 [Aspergillus niger]KAI3059126.1 hypothetical protein CBS147343_10000 [Aspergillus niger]